MYEKNSSVPAPMSFHRLFKKPLDDTSIFYSMEDLVSYVKTGAVYNGQKITLISSYLDNKLNNIRTFTIYDGVPIIDLSPSEYILRDHYNTTEKSLLIYNRYNNRKSGDDIRPITSDTINTSYYSIIDIIDLFYLLFDTNKYEFLLNAMYIKDNKWNSTSINIKQSSPLSNNVSSTSSVKICQNTEEAKSNSLFILDDPEGMLSLDKYGRNGISGKYEIAPQCLNMYDNKYKELGYIGYVSKLYMSLPEEYSNIISKYNL